MTKLDQYRGCLLGGAAGDALGYTVEFMREPNIFYRYGSTGISKFELAHGVAQISDDTQMTLFTANALLCATTRGRTRGTEVSYPSCIGDAYKMWLETQGTACPSAKPGWDSWLMNVPELFSRRAPGNTCIFAIRAGANGTLETPINNSKGCGGVMRVAPIGLYFNPDRCHCTLEEVDQLGAEAAALTHGHELGWIPAAALVHIIYQIVHAGSTPMEAALDMREAMAKQFATAKHLPEFLALVDKAIELSQSNWNDLQAIHALGEGWVAEETLAIALYCALKYSNDFEKAVVTAVNHNGDSDSTGAVCGNILGAYLGESGIPEKFKTHLELQHVIRALADDLYNDYLDDPVWTKKYIDGTYTP